MIEPAKYPKNKIFSKKINKTIGMCEIPKGTKTECNYGPLGIKKNILSGNWNYDFKKYRKDIFYDKTLNI